MWMVCLRTMNVYECYYDSILEECTADDDSYVMLWRNTAVLSKDFKASFSAAGSASQEFCSCALVDGKCVSTPETLWRDVFWYPTSIKREEIIAQGGLGLILAFNLEGHDFPVGPELKQKVCHLPGGLPFGECSLEKFCCYPCPWVAECCRLSVPSIKSVDWPPSLFDDVVQQ